jgi:hypothetical protein
MFCFLLGVVLHIKGLGTQDSFLEITRFFAKNKPQQEVETSKFLVLPSQFRKRRQKINAMSIQSFIF